MAWRTLIGRNLQSVKLFACPTGASSAAARTFYEANYNVVKHLNPAFPFMIRAMPNVEPYLVVEYGAWEATVRIAPRNCGTRDALTAHATLLYALGGAPLRAPSPAAHGSVSPAHARRLEQQGQGPA